MKWSLDELSKKKQIEFDTLLDLKEELSERSPEVLDCTPIKVTGRVSYDDGLYFLDYQIEGELTLPSSRSLKPVPYPIDIGVNEIFTTAENTDDHPELLDNDLILILEKTLISLDESVADNILLEIPLQILAEDEERGADMPAGKFWSVLTEEEYERQQAEKEGEKSSPFAGLDGLFDD